MGSWFDFGNRQVLQKLDKVLQALSIINQKGDKIMAEMDDLKTAIATLKDQVTTLGASITNEIQRVETIITNLSVPGILPAEVAAATADLQSVSDNLKAAISALDTERA